MSSEIQPDYRFAQVAGLDINRVPDGSVVYQADADRVHFLNPTAMIIFELCDGQLTVSDIKEILVSAYDLESFPSDEFYLCFDNLVAEGLLVRCNP